MNSNQELLKKHFLRLFELCDKHVECVVAFEKSLNDIKKLRIIDEDKIPLKKKLQKDFIANVQHINKSLEFAIEDVRKVAISMEQPLPFDEDFNGAIQFIRAGGMNIPAQTRESVWKRFIGSQYQLTLLRSVYKEIGASCATLDQYIFSAEIKCDELIEHAFRMTIKPEASMIHIISMRALVERFATQEGVDLGTAHKDTFAAQVASGVAFGIGAGLYTTPQI